MSSSDSSERLPDLCCPICFSGFSSKVNVPHMLRCGHTHCDQCLESLIKQVGGGRCGECRTTIVYKTVKTVPINYSIIRLIEAMKEKNINHTEFHEVQGKIDDMMKKLNENQDLYRGRIRDIHRKIDDMEQEKKQLKDTKQGLKTKCAELGKSKSLGESFAIIQGTMEKIKKVEQQSSLISDRLEKGFDVDMFQSLLDSPEDFLIRVNGAYASTYFISCKKIYMNAMQSIPDRKKKFEVTYKLLQPFMIGTFLIMEYKGNSVMLEIETFKGSQRALQFEQLCAGETGTSYIGSRFYDHSRFGREGESVVLGCSDRSRSLFDDLKKGSCRVDSIRSGHVEAITGNKGKTTHVRIYLEDWPSRSSETCFGMLKRGGSILKKVFRNRYEARISGCGIIFDPTLII